MAIPFFYATVENNISLDCVPILTEENRLTLNCVSLNLPDLPEVFNLTLKCNNKICFLKENETIVIRIFLKTGRFELVKGNADVIASTYCKRLGGNINLVIGLVITKI